MTIKEIVGFGGGGLFLLLTLIQISPIKVNPWSFLAKKLGRAINSEVLERVDELDRKIDAVDQKTEEISAKSDERSAIDCRVKILRFGDELLHGVSHSKEHFDQILLDITEYQRYCDTHPKFTNHVTVITTKRIEDAYQHLLNTNGFL